MKAFMMAAAVVAGIAANAAKAAPLPEAKPDDVGFSQQGLARLDDFFAREIAAKRVPGAVVAIARDGKLVQYKAYGQLDPAKGTAMPLDAVFALASMTKPMAAVAGLTLMEQGRLPLQQARGLFSGVRRHEGRRGSRGGAAAPPAGFSDL